MSRAYRIPRASEAALIAVRVRAAIANNPAIGPRQLAEQSGLTLAQAIAELERHG
jgi:hypothetical protein